MNGEKEFSEEKGWNNVLDKNNAGEGWNNVLEKTNAGEEWNSPIAPRHLENSDIIDSDMQHDFSNQNSNLYEPNKQRNDSALNRTISFFGDNVKLPRKAKVEQGNYDFRIDNIASKENVAGKFGPYDQLFITFSVQKMGMEVPQQITIPYIVSTKSESPFMVFLSSFKSLFQGQNITINQLVGLVGTCEISHFEPASGDIYERLLVKSVNS